MPPPVFQPRLLAVSLALAAAACTQPRSGTSGDGPSPQQPGDDAQGSGTLAADAGMPSDPDAAISPIPWPDAAPATGDAGMDVPAGDMLASAPPARVLWGDLAGVATDVAVFGDSVYTTGRYLIGDSFGDMVLPPPDHVDMFLAKYDGAGKPQWVRLFTGPQWQSGMAVAVAPDGTVAVTGNAIGGPVTVSGMTAGGPNGSTFLAVFSPDGQLRRLQPDLGSWALAYDSGGNLITSTPGDLTTKLDPTGKRIWPALAPPIGFEVVAIDRQDNVVGCHRLEAALTVAGTTHRPLGQSDVLVVKISPAGTIAWARWFGGDGADTCQGIATDAAGDIVFGGSFDGGLRLPDGVRSGKGKSDAFFAKLAGADGRLLWLQTFGDRETDWVGSIAIDRTGDVLVGARLMSPVAFGNWLLEPILDGGMLLKFAGGTGAPLAAYRLYSFLNRMEPHPSGDLLVVGAGVLRLGTP